MADFSANQVQGCAPLLVQFTNLSTGSPTSVLWNFGNGNTSTLNSPGASYILPGVYTVTLTATNGGGSNTKTRTSYITVFPKPVAGFTSTPNSGCAPLPVSFTDTSKVSGSTITAWGWDFGDGGFSTSKNPVNNYTASGSYKVTLVVTDAHGCTDNISKTGLITVASKPTVDFISDVTYSCDVPLTARFISSITPGGAYSYKWDFGNGTFSNSLNPAATYTIAANADVKFQVWNSQKCTVTVTKPAYIQFGNIVPDFVTASSQPCANGSISLLNKTLPDLPGANYEWYVNNVLRGTSKDLALSNLPPGSYAVKLKVQMGACTRVVDRPAYFTVYPKPRSLFKGNDSVFCKPPANVTFTNMSTGATSWDWSFGDGQVSNLQNPVITYTQYGTFDVSLISTSANGCKETLVRKGYIKIIAPAVTLAISPKEGCKTLQVNFSINDSTVPPLSTFAWTFGDAAHTGSSSKNTSFSYPDVGVYPITFFASNAAGCTVIKYDTVRVGQLQTIDFSAIKREYCYEDQPVTLQNATVGALPGTAWLWKYGDSVQSAGLNGVHVYKKDTGYYDITLEANHNGCKSSVTKNDYIHILGPIPSFKKSTLPCTKAPVTFTNTTKGGLKFEWDFGDSSTYTGFHAVHTYQKPGSYIVKMLASDSITGCHSIAVDTVVIDFSIDPSFTQSIGAACVPFVLTLNNTSTPLSAVAQCKFTVNGATYTGNSVNIPITMGGVFDIVMVVKDLKGCQVTYTKPAAVRGVFLQPDINVTPAFTCAPVTVLGTDSTKAVIKITRRVWYWGNGDSTVYTNSDSINARYKYTQGPPVQTDGYMVKLVLTDSIGCRNFRNFKIYISKPRPDFATETFKKCDMDSLVFTPVADNSIGLTPISFVWKLDGFTIPGRVLRKSFSGDTTIPLELHVSDAYGCKDSIVKQVKVFTGSPVADFTANPLSINCPGPPVHFYDQSYSKISPLVSWDWEFGDGARSVLQNPSRIYIMPGSYSVMLTVKDSLGCVGTKINPDFIVIGGPRGIYGFTPDKGCTPLHVLFNSMASNVAKYEWDLADGTIDTNQNLSHTYTRSGIYIPNLTITDSTGCKVGLPPVDSIVVLPNPSPDFTLSRYSACVNSDIVFQGTIQHTSPIVLWSWLIDSVAHTGQGPLLYHASHTGGIDATLTVTDEEGCLGMISKPAILNVFSDTVNNEKPTLYRATVESDTEVKVEFIPATEPDFDHYILFSDFAGNLPLTQRNLATHDDTVQLFSSLNTLHNTYRYMLQSVDVCGNYSVQGRKHTTIELQAAGRLNAVELNWSAYEGWDSVAFYAVSRLNDNTAHFDSIGVVSGSTLTYIDSATYCNKVMYYRVKAIGYGLNPLVSWSDTAAAIPVFVATIPATRTLRATVINNKDILLQWFGRRHKYPFTYVIQRESADPTAPARSFTLNAKDTFFIDKDVDVQRYSYTYLVFLKDVCGGLSLSSNRAKTIVLHADIATDMVSSDPVLTWNAYEEWASGVHKYDLLFKYDSLPAYTSIAARTPDQELRVLHEYINYNQDDYCYQVVAFQKDSDWVESWSNIACVSTSPRLYAPNAITINGDKLNDGFRLEGIFIKSFSLKIWNRWGVLMFETNNMNEAWDGTYKGEPMPSDVYVFEAFGYGKKGQYKALKGNVTILR